MAFPPELLNRDEELVLDLRPHWWYFAPAAALLGALLLLGLIALNWGDGFFGQAGKLIIGIGLLVAIGWFASRYAQWYTTNFVVTSDRVIYRVGVFAKKGTEIPLDKINAVHFEQRIFERILGLGTITIESASESGRSIFEDIRKPSAVQNVIYQQADAQGDRDAERMGQVAAQAVNAGGSGSDQPTVPEHIAQLDDLRKQGAITEAEYQLKKAELLGRM